MSRDPRLCAGCRRNPAACACPKRAGDRCPLCAENVAQYDGPSGSALICDGCDTAWERRSYTAADYARATGQPDPAPSASEDERPLAAGDTHSADVEPGRGDPVGARAVTERSQAMSHPCDACGGTGQPHEHTFQCFETLCLANGRCLVCLGGGRISDRMPVADALADAETLLLFASVNHDARTALGKLSGLWRRAADIETIVACGGDNDGSDWRCFQQAHYSARAAFRAVPGLRGDR